VIQFASEHPFYFTVLALPFALVLAMGMGIVLGILAMKLGDKIL